jgi:hypothetical protein
MVGLSISGVVKLALSDPQGSLRHFRGSMKGVGGRNESSLNFGDNVN